MVIEDIRPLKTVNFMHNQITLEGHANTTVYRIVSLKWNTYITLLCPVFHVNFRQYQWKEDEEEII